MPPALGAFQVNIRDAAHAFHHIQLSLFCLDETLPLLKSVLGQLNVHLAFIIIIHSKTRVGVPHLVPHISIGSHSEKITGSSCTEIASKGESRYGEWSGKRRRHLIPILHSFIHASGDNYI